MEARTAIDGPTLDDIMEDEDFAKNSQSLFVESSLNSIRRGQMNNKGGCTGNLASMWQNLTWEVKNPFPP